MITLFKIKKLRQIFLDKDYQEEEKVITITPTTHSMIKQEIIRRNPTGKGLRSKQNTELVDILKEINISNPIAVDYIISNETELR